VPPMTRYGPPTTGGGEHPERLARLGAGSTVAVDNGSTANARRWTAALAFSQAEWQLSGKL